MSRKTGRLRARILKAVAASLTGAALGGLFFGIVGYFLRDTDNSTCAAIDRYVTLGMSWVWNLPLESSICWLVLGAVLGGIAAPLGDPKHGSHNPVGEGVALVVFWSLVAVSIGLHLFGPGRPAVRADTAMKSHQEALDELEKSSRNLDREFRELDKQSHPLAGAGHLEQNQRLLKRFEEKCAAVKASVWSDFEAASIPESERTRAWDGYWQQRNVAGEAAPYRNRLESHLRRFSVSDEQLEGMVCRAFFAWWKLYRLSDLERSGTIEDAQERVTVNPAHRYLFDGDGLLFRLASSAPFEVRYRRGSEGQIILGGSSFVITLGRPLVVNGRLLHKKSR
jgi:hypothetical protein